MLLRWHKVKAWARKPLRSEDRARNVECRFSALSSDNNNYSFDAISHKPAQRSAPIGAGGEGQAPTIATGGDRTGKDNAATLYPCHGIGSDAGRPRLAPCVRHLPDGTSKATSFSVLRLPSKGAPPHCARTLLGFIFPMCGFPLCCLSALRSTGPRTVSAFSVSRASISTSI